MACVFQKCLVLVCLRHLASSLSIPYFPNREARLVNQTTIIQRESRIGSVEPNRIESQRSERTSSTKHHPSPPAPSI
ncbi:uncharacterized protein B0T15DRAFT_177492 [Chaetomium strumarium]|uniref:Secreted protein n=1 Tax=Chaetomium strumarium TaxID=1170767 RepID=A0AAJ0GWK8_9PEZI|nr:hypothetical protein B0T15DRAFT_177492 [Chaetomium strumarium]